MPNSYSVQAEAAPRIGDELRDHDRFSGRLTNVIRDVDRDRFSCRVADEVPYNNSNYLYDYEMVNRCRSGCWLCT